MLVLLLAMVQGTWAQSAFGNVPETVDAANATITKMGHLTMTVEKEVTVDPLTQKTDTLVKVKNIEWNTETGTAQARQARRQAPRRSGFDNKECPR